VRPTEPGEPDGPDAGVRDRGIAFTALLRRTGIYSTTAEIPRAIIASALAAAV